MISLLFIYPITNDEALQAQAGNELDVENPGIYKMTIKASDGHGNVTSEVVDIEVVDELIYK